MMNNYMTEKWFDLVKVIAYANYLLAIPKFLDTCNAKSGDPSSFVKFVPHQFWLKDSKRDLDVQKPNFKAIATTKMKLSLGNYSPRYFLNAKKK